MLTDYSKQEKKKTNSTHNRWKQEDTDWLVKWGSMVYCCYQHFINVPERSFLCIWSVSQLMYAYRLVLYELRHSWVCNEAEVNTSISVRLLWFAVWHTVCCWEQWLLKCWGEKDVIPKWKFTGTIIQQRYQNGFTTIHFGIGEQLKRYILTKKPK